MSNRITVPPRGPVQRVAVLDGEDVVNVIIRNAGDPLQPGEAAAGRAKPGDKIRGGQVIPGAPTPPSAVAKAALVRAMREAGKWDSFATAYAAADARTRLDWDVLDPVALRDAPFVAIANAAGFSQREIVKLFKDAR